MAGSDISALLERRGLDLRQEDIDDLRAMIVQLDPDEADAIAGNVWEAVAMVLQNPEYVGDAKLPEPDSD